MSRSASASPSASARARSRAGGRRAAASVVLLALLAGCAESAVEPGDVRVVSLGGSAAMEGWSVNYPKQPKLLFVAGRLYVFYADGRDMVVRSTADGDTFGETALVRQGMSLGHRCAFATDGAAIHSACCAAEAGADVLYRRGAPDGAGAIAWEEEQVAFDVSDGQSVLYPKIVLEAGGRPWVGWMLFEGGFETAPQSAMVARSRRTDGVWETDDGFPYVLATSTETFPDPLGVGLASGGTYWIVDPDGNASYRGRAWREGAWGDEEIVSHESGRHGLFSAVADGDVVHVAYRTGALHHRRRAADGTWGEPTLLSRTAGGHTTIASLGEDRVRVVWIDRFAGERVVSREIGPTGLSGAELLLDAAPYGGLSGRLAINLNGLAAPAGPFADALTVAVGGDPHEVLLLLR